MSGGRASTVRLLGGGLAVALAVLGSVEGALVILDIDPPWDSLHRAYRVSRLFVPAMVDGEPGVRTRTAYLRVFPAIAFREDPDGAFRIMTAGGSFVQGWGVPDPRSQAFPARFGDHLGAAGRRRVEVINCGAPGYGAYRIAPLVEELIRHRPGLLMVFTGHNEFWESAIHRRLMGSGPSTAKLVAALEPLRLYRGLGWAMEAANRRWLGFATDWGGRYARVDDAAYATVAREYRERLDRICAACRAANVPLVLGTVPVNLRCDPESRASTCRGASRSRADAAGQARCAEELRRAREAEEAGRSGEAVSHYRAALRADPGEVAVHWRIARCLERLGRFDDAREAYWRHLESCRRGVVREWNEILRDVARRRGVPVADAARWFEVGAPGGIPDPHWFQPGDDAHLSLAGQERLAARLFAERARLLQNTVYMKGSVLEPAKINSAAPSSRATSGTIHHARRARANAMRSAKRRAV